ncbi:hypothetical protein PR048_016135 [Dryococelus australis]|uniref:Uncharacterized protein n=1 Tax=Dryococelus australis TaxID=614101 RepID=A0ABQ9HIW8_9NEOP|nr:hypothetical protein PR048_016135 [Dryococelus australis]
MKPVPTYKEAVDALETIWLYLNWNSISSAASSFAAERGRVQNGVVSSASSSWGLERLHFSKLCENAPSRHLKETAVCSETVFGETLACIRAVANFSWWSYCMARKISAAAQFPITSKAMADPEAAMDSESQSLKCAVSDAAPRDASDKRQNTTQKPAPQDSPATTALPSGHNSVTKWRCAAANC